MALNLQIYDFVGCELFDQNSFFKNLQKNTEWNNWPISTLVNIMIVWYYCWLTSYKLLKSYWDRYGPLPDTRLFGFRKTKSDNLAPGASQRKLCYAAKDKYYECMVRNNESMDACKELMDKFHSSCLKSWVSTVNLSIFWLLVSNLSYTFILQVVYFERKHEYENFKTKMIEMGAEPLEIHWKEGNDKWNKSCIYLFIIFISLI